MAVWGGGEDNEVSGCWEEQIVEESDRKKPGEVSFASCFLF